MSRLGFYEVGKSGATIRAEPSLCSAKVGRANYLVVVAAMPLPALTISISRALGAKQP